MCAHKYWFRFYTVSIFANTYNSIQYQSFACTQLLLQALLFNTKYSIQHYSSKFLRRSLIAFIIKGFRSIYCYFHNVPADMSSGLLQVFVELGNLHRTSNFIESTGVSFTDSVCHNRVQVLSIPILLLACSQD